MNKRGSEVMCRVESLSIRESLSIPESFKSNFEPFNEEKIIRVYRECPIRGPRSVFTKKYQTRTFIRGSVFSSECEYNGY
jgi:hypothetical protein